MIQATIKRGKGTDVEEIAPFKSNNDYLPHWLIAIDDDTYVNPITLLSLLSGMDASSSVMYGNK